MVRQDDSAHCRHFPSLNEIHKTMKITTTPVSMIPKRGSHDVAHLGRTHGAFAVLAVLIGLDCDIARCRLEAGGNDSQGAEVLTRGPVHEAFAGVVSFNPEPGVIVDKAPPEAIEELPPEERPEGDNITWIPGYWAWDDERSDFLWISGTWRALPPGREWIAGYWAAVREGYQWISGYWADAAVEETTYLPNRPQPWKPDRMSQPLHRITDGHRATGSGIRSVTRGGRVIGRKAGRIGNGCPLTMSGLREDIFSSMAIGIMVLPGVASCSRRCISNRGVYSRPGYRYSPLVAINLLAFMENLFLRPSYHHYYFGDYYEPRYQDGRILFSIRVSIQPLRI